MTKRVGVALRDTAGQRHCPYGERAGAVHDLGNRPLMEGGRHLAGLAFRGILRKGKELALLPGDIDDR
jgi:hypothetical protein